VSYHTKSTGLLVIDPYNDFISEGGKLWDRLRRVAEANSCVPHMLQVLNAARRAGLRVFYALRYDVTAVKDAIVDYSDQHMHAALEVNIPNYASAIVTTRDIVDSMSFQNV
jgi:nicotinamidase-related amidase